MGKLIVIEGSDGSGKATQAKKLFDRLSDLESKVKRLSFPNYESESSALIRMYLRGDFGGSAEAVNPYAAATFYAVDRFASYFEWKNFYKEGGIVISDRYVESNMVYQVAKLTKKGERNKFLTWLEDLEYNRYGLPRADLTIFLDMPPEVSAILRKKRGRDDIHGIRNSPKNMIGKSSSARKEISPETRRIFLKIFCHWSRKFCCVPKRRKRLQTDRKI